MTARTGHLLRLCTAGWSFGGGKKQTNKTPAVSDRWTEFKGQTQMTVSERGHMVQDSLNRQNKKACTHLTMVCLSVLVIV